MPATPETLSGSSSPASSRPPFEPGNALAVRHGAHSPGIVGKRATEIAERIAPIVPNYNESHAPTVELLARELARIELADEWLDEHGIFDGEGKPAGILKMRSVWTNSAARLANDLALNPTAQAKLGLHVARARGEALRVHLSDTYGGDG
jgi:hypothetical protein